MSAIHVTQAYSPREERRRFGRLLDDAELLVWWAGGGHEWFGEVRSLLHREPSRDAFRRVIKALRLVPKDEHRAAAVAYAHRHLDRHWSPATRHTALALERDLTPLVLSVHVGTGSNWLRLGEGRLAHARELCLCWNGTHTGAVLAELSAAGKAHEAVRVRHSFSLTEWRQEAFDAIFPKATFERVEWHWHSR